MAKREFRTVKLGPDDLVCVVPLSNQSEAILDKESMDFLMKLGLSSSWCVNGGIITTAGRLSSNRHVSVARVIMDAGPNEVVYYRDKNRTNLRLSNLYIKKGKASKRDRLYV